MAATPRLAGTSSQAGASHWLSLLPRPLAILGLAAVYLAIVGRACSLVLANALNVPYFDDYQAILRFANALEQATGFRKRLLLVITWQNGEYKLPLQHLFTWLQLLLTHQVNFVVHTMAGNLFLLLLLGLLWFMSFKDERSLTTRMLLFLPVVLLVCGLNYAEITAWASGAMMYQPFLFFAAASACCLAAIARPAAQPAAQSGRQRQPRTLAFAGAAVFALLACLACPAAITLFPLGLAVLVPSRRLRQGVLWCAPFALGLAPNLIHVRGLTSLEPQHPWMAIPYFFSFVGSGFPTASTELSGNWTPNLCYLAIPLGIVMLAIIVDSLRTRFYRGHLAATLFTLTLLGSGLMTAIGRSNLPLFTSTTSRYKLFSDLLLVFCYVYLASRIRGGSLRLGVKRSLLAAAIAGFALFFLNADWQGDELLTVHRRVVVFGVDHFWQQPDTNAPFFRGQPGFDSRFAWEENSSREVTLEASRLGIYSLPRPSELESR